MKHSVWFALVFVCLPAVGSAFTVLFEGESPYHHVQVSEDAGYRFLSFDKTRGTQSAMKMSDPTFLYYEYSRVAFAALAYIEEPQDVLFVGLGGASMIKFFRKHYPDVQIDVAEVDPLVIKVAQDYFEFKPDEKTNVHKRDGRVFIGKVKKQYDVIFLDAYNARSIPFHLTTKEFLEAVRKRLKPNGVAVSNIWSPELNQYFEAEIKTFQVTFPELYIYRAGNSGNYIFIATNKAGRVSKLRLADRARQIDREKRFHFELAELIKRHHTYATNRPCNERVLTDDHAPVNVMRWRENE